MPDDTRGKGRALVAMALLALQIVVLLMFLVRFYIWEDHRATFRTLELRAERQAGFVEAIQLLSGGCRGP